MAVPSALSLWEISTAPNFEAYLPSGGQFHRAINGGIMPYRMESTGKGNQKVIAERAHIREIGISPAQAAKLVYGVVSAIVAQEQLARIDRKLDRIASVLDEIKSSINDDILAPIRIAAASAQRFRQDGASSVPTDVAHSWLNSLRHSRERIVPMINRIMGATKPTTSFLASSKLQDISDEVAKLNGGAALVEALVVCDALLLLISESFGADWAGDGIDFSQPKRLSRQIGKSVTSLVKAAHIDMQYDKAFRSKVYETVAPTRKRLGVIADMVDRAEEVETLKALIKRESITVTISEGQIVGLNRLIGVNENQVE